MVDFRKLQKYIGTALGAVMVAVASALNLQTSTTRVRTFTDGERGWGTAAMIVIWLIALTLVILSTRRAHRRRTVSGLPTSKALAVFDGLNEVQGTVSTRDPLRARFSRHPVVWYHATTEELRGSGKNRRWVTILNETRHVPFHLRDDSGTIIVYPAEAQVSGDRVFRWRGREGDSWLTRKQRRKTEFAIRTGQQVYVLGSAQWHPTVASPVIVDDDDSSTPFLITTRSEQSVDRNLRWQTVGFQFAAVVLALLAHPVGRLVTGMLYNSRTDLTAFPQTRPALIVIPGVLAIGAVLASNVVSVVNGLIEARERLSSSWSLIDVQLQRRNDLLPNLADLAERHAMHERALLEASAELRAERLGAYAPERLAEVNAVLATETAAVQRLHALAEAFPNLAADGLFVRVQHALEDSEDRIAYARDYYDEIVETMRNRAGSVAGALASRVVEVPDTTFAVDRTGGVET